MAVESVGQLVPLYPLYPLLFSEHGISDAGVSALFVLWSLTSLLLEVPSGALADSWSRPRLLAVSGLLGGAAFAGWVVVPSVPVFALGFVLWGTSTALASGTVEALTYDALVVRGAPEAYPVILGRARAGSLVAIVVASLAAAPLVAAGGYLLVGLVSAGTGALMAALALTLPDDRPAEGDEESDEEPASLTAWGAMLRAGLRETRRDAVVRRAVVAVALVTGLIAVDEYLPLIAADGGAGPELVAVLFAALSVGEIGGALVASRWTRPGGRSLALVVVGAAGATAVGVLLPVVAGFVLLAGAFGLLQILIVALDTRVQDAVTGPARATVTSVAGFGTEAVGIGVFAGVGLGSGWATLPVVVAMAMTPMLLAAALLLRSARG